jgi:hypothetical protein
MKSLGHFPSARISSLRPRLSSRTIRLATIIVAAVLAVFAISSRHALVRTRAANTRAKSVTVHAEGKSNSLIHLQDGYELSARFGNDAQGLVTEPKVATTIGSITPNGRNTVSANGWDGIWRAEITTNPANASVGGLCSIAGNNIGTDITGAVSMGNTDNHSPFVRLASGQVTVNNNYSVSNIGASGGTTPGGPCTGFCNLISGRIISTTTFDGFFAGPGLFAIGNGTIGIYSNYIGINISGNNPGAISIVGNNIGVGNQGQSLGNAGAGIAFMFSVTGAAIGGSTAAEENLIQDNGLSGILLSGSSTRASTGVIAEP